MLRLLGLLLAAALISALLFGACVAACGVAMVSVVADGAPNIVAPVPLMLPLAALHLVPDHLAHDEMHEEMDALGGAAVLALGPFARALEAAGDAELVRVTDGEDQVLIATEGGDLVIRVREGGDSGNRVFLRTPLEVLEDIGDVCEAYGRLRSPVRSPGDGPVAPDGRPRHGDRGPGRRHPGGHHGLVGRSSEASASSSWAWVRVVRDVKAGDR